MSMWICPTHGLHGPMADGCAGTTRVEAVTVTPTARDAFWWLWRQRHSDNWAWAALEEHFGGYPGGLVAPEEDPQ